MNERPTSSEDSAMDTWAKMLREGTGYEYNASGVPVADPSSQMQGDAARVLPSVK